MPKSGGAHRYDLCTFGKEPIYVGIFLVMNDIMLQRWWWWGGTNIPLPPQAKKWGGTCPPCPPASYASDYDYICGFFLVILLLLLLLLLLIIIIIIIIIFKTKLVYTPVSKNTIFLTLNKYKNNLGILKKQIKIKIRGI